MAQSRFQRHSCAAFRWLLATGKSSARVSGSRLAMIPRVSYFFCWLLVALSCRAVTGAPPNPPLPNLANRDQLPRYEIEANVDVAKHQVTGTQRITWTNRHARPAEELVCNVFSHYKMPDEIIGFEAKMLEINRLRPSETLDYDGEAFQIQRVEMASAASPPYGVPPARLAIKYRYENEGRTALVIPLSTPVRQGESVTVLIRFVMRLPQKQGRWGQWNGVTSLINWLPVAAFYDENGWRPVPLVYWHPATYNEAGMYSARITLPADHLVAGTSGPTNVRDLPEKLRQWEFGPVLARDFSLVASNKFVEVSQQVGGVLVRCLAFPEHAHYARIMLEETAHSVASYSRWFGNYPYREISVAESYVGWNGASASGLVLMEQRAFQMPHAGKGFAEYLVAQQVARQWTYNLVGSNGYSQTWLDEGLASYFGNRLLDEKLGKKNDFLHWPTLLSWLPQIDRETYRHFGFVGAMKRGESTAIIQDIPKFEHSMNLTSMAADRGGKVVGMIEDRMGSERFVEFMRLIYYRYWFQCLTVQDFQRELEAFTNESWETFFQQWLFSTGMADWKITKVEAENDNVLSGVFRFAGDYRRDQSKQEFVKTTVIVEQAGEISEPTTLGFAMRDTETYDLRVQINPLFPQEATWVQVNAAGDAPFPNLPPAKVERLDKNRLRVEVSLPTIPQQIAVDPDQRIIDREPSNNFWRTPVRVKVMPVYTPIEESDLTCRYDRWNLFAGPWISDSAYQDPWFSFTEIAGARAGVFRTRDFNMGVYTGYRTNFKDFAVGFDVVKEHWPFPNTQVGINAERSISTIGQEGSNGSRGPDRGILFGRYIVDETDSLYQLPMHYLETFSSIADNYFPVVRQAVPGSIRIPSYSLVGFHYHINYLTPYWDAEGGFEFDATYAAGLEVFGSNQSSQQVSAQFSTVFETPENLGWLSTTRLAARAFGAFGLPNNALLFTLGGSQLFRGYDLGDRQGSAAWITSLEWRIPILLNRNYDFADHVVSFRNSYAALFYDVGNTYTRSQSTGPIAHAVGVSLRYDVAWFSFMEHTMLRFDLAKTVNDNTPVQFWFGTEHPF